MDDLLAIATLLDNRFRIADWIGYGEGTEGCG